MLKVAYQMGLEMAIKEAGLTEDELEKLAKFLWYRDWAEAFPTFKKMFGMPPDMAHRVAGTAAKAGKAGAKAMKKAPVRQTMSRAADPRMATFSRGTFSR